MNISDVIELKPNPNIPEITSGDTVKVSTRVVEGDKERIQVFQGVVIKIRRRGPGSSFTVRRVTYGVGVERTFPLYSPRVEKVEVVRHGKKRRAKLYYLRGLSAKTSRLKERRVSQKEMEREQERLRMLQESKDEEKRQAQAEVAEQEAEEVPQAVEEPEAIAEETAGEVVEETAPEAVEEPAEAPQAEQEAAPEAEAEEAPEMEKKEADAPASQPEAEPEQEESKE